MSTLATEGMESAPSTVSHTMSSTTTSTTTDTEPGLRSPTRTALWLGFATIYLVWGSTYLGIRMAVQTLPPFAMASMRFAVAGLVLAAFLRLTRGPLGITRRQLLDNTLVGACLLLGGNGLVSWAEQYLPSGITALIIGSQPLIMVLTEWAFPGGHRPGKLTAAGLVLGFAGVAWLVAPWQDAGAESLHLGGALAVLAACLCWAFGSIYGRNAKSPASPFVASALQMLAGSVLLALVALLRGEWQAWEPSQTSASSWWALLYLCAVGSLVGFSTFAWLMKHSTPARVSTYAYVNPVVAVILGAVVLDEAVGPRLITATVVIIASVVIITVAKTRKA